MNKILITNRSLRFSKRFFYFQDDAVEAKQLAVFHQHEKPAVANPIAAWASQTGKGLFFFTKRAEDKATPAGIFGLVCARYHSASMVGSNKNRPMPPTSPRRVPPSSSSR